MSRTFKTLAAAMALCGLAPLHAETIYGMRIASNSGLVPGLSLVRFDSATPNVITTIGNFSGVVAGQAIRSIDFRPATGQLYAISNGTTGATASNAQLYTVNLATAALTPVGAGLTLTGNTASRIEMDFNPVADRVRIIVAGTTNLSYRADPNTGALVAVDTPLDYAAGDPLAGSGPVVLAAAYSNNVAGAGSTTLYGWDYNTDALATIGGLGGTPSPNTGQMFTVAVPAGLLTSLSAIGMDISGASGILYVTHDDPDTGTFMSLFTRDLVTGAETKLGDYGSGVFIGDISAAPVPEPAAWMLGAAGLLGLLVRQRRARATIALAG
jgi:MYXO-CTERM domain-containing protein